MHRTEARTECTYDFFVTFIKLHVGVVPFSKSQASFPLPQLAKNGC